MSNNNKKYIIFDCGGVLANDMQYTFATQYVQDNMPSKMDVFNKSLKTHWSRIRIDANYTDRQFWQDVAHDIGLTMDDQLLDSFVQQTRQELHSNPPSLQYVNTLRESGTSMFILSNHGKDWFNYIRDSDPMFLKAFPDTERLIVSYMVDSYKPQQEIFQKCWEHILLLEVARPLNKSQFIFIDDKLANVHAAQQFGYNAAQFNYAESPITTLSNVIDQFLNSP
ncbi:hypothetical protein SAMD00019534_077500, partial [Acytostelium subglobosum LB1]|uniref:hypothetical protein n=1 Tax=Acytostelium subglobosum LB1 TaxID=1410327 RepID=UPI000644EB0F